MPRQDSDEQYADEDTERRAREAIRRSFELPYKSHKELVGKTPRGRARNKSVSSKTAKKPK